MSETGSSSKLNEALSKAGRKSRFAAKAIAQAEYLALPFSKGLNRKICTAVKTFLPESAQKDRRRVRRIKKDMLFSRMYYETDFNQYFLFDFEKKTDRGRREFVGAHEKARYTDHLHRTSTTYQIFRNKYTSYQTFREFYKRDAVQLGSEADKEAFAAFAKRHPRFILKVEDAALGSGIRIEDLGKSGESPEAAFDRILAEPGIHLAEELIVQAEELARIHPASVNTVRFVTYLKGDKVEHMFSFLRMGAGGGIIDNATAGGISAAIDLKTGIVTTPGCREDQSRFLKHPDTGVQIIGMQIPRWDELLGLADRLARVVPEQKYVGWDLALTPDGWVMVEGNDSAMMTAIQMCERKGLRPVFDRLFKQ